jgi:hypothetical protein
MKCFVPYINYTLSLGLFPTQYLCNKSNVTGLVFGILTEGHIACLVFLVQELKSGKHFASLEKVMNQ